MTGEERIILRLPTGSGAGEAQEAARLAYHFASSKLDGKAGIRHGTVYKMTSGRVYCVYWTASRSVVVSAEATR
jgi:hypothetical protein